MGMSNLLYLLCLFVSPSVVDRNFIAPRGWEEAIILHDDASLDRERRFREEMVALREECAALRQEMAALEEERGRLREEMLALREEQDKLKQELEDMIALKEEHAKRRRVKRRVMVLRSVAYLLLLVNIAMFINRIRIS